MYVYQLSCYRIKIEKKFFGLKCGKFFIEGSSVQLKEKILVPVLIKSPFRDVREII